MPPKKDPNKPKGRMSAYAFYVQERRNQYRKEGREVQFTEFSKECAVLWKDLDKAKKEKFFEKAKLDRERYDQEMADYVPLEGYGDSKGKKKGGGKKRKKDPNQPKRAM